MESAPAQSTAAEGDVRQGIANTLAQRGGSITQNAPGMLVVEFGSVGSAYLAGGFRNVAKMPVKVTVTTNAGTDGTGILVQVTGRGGSGFMSGGILGQNKQRKAERAWLEATIAAIPQRSG